MPAHPNNSTKPRPSDDGRFEVRAKGAHSDGVLYLVAAGGVPKASKAGGDNSAIAFLALSGQQAPSQRCRQRTHDCRLGFYRRTIHSGGSHLWECARTA